MNGVMLVQSAFSLWWAWLAMAFSGVGIYLGCLRLRGEVAVQGTSRPLALTALAGMLLCGVGGGIALLMLARFFIRVLLP
jgi:hypothetical protein